NTIPVHACPYFLGTRLKMEDYYDAGSRLKIGFHGDRGVSEQIIIILFGEGTRSSISWSGA
ncbi:MAG: hypothetical protein LZ169_00330, partial [Thaumarchaeota archaeon]|nr:hypothetical protein [Candidatus Wolframiiraptor allenii]